MSTFREQLEAKYHFDEWREQRNSEQAVLTKGYFLSPWQVPGWNPLRHRVQSVSEGTSKHVVYLSDQKERSDRGMTVSFVECASLRAAHEQLLTLLGEFQSPEVSRDLGSPLGDVCFTSPSRTTALFSRGNLVFLVQQAERGTVPVHETAKALDRTIAEPPSPSTKTQAEIHRVSLREEPVEAGTTRIEAAIDDPLHRPYWLRFLATSVGELWLDTAGLVHASKKVGAESSVEVTTYNEHGWSSEARTLLR